LRRGSLRGEAGAQWMLGITADETVPAFIWLSVSSSNRRSHICFRQCCGSRSNPFKTIIVEDRYISGSNPLQQDIVCLLPDTYRFYKLVFILK